MLSFNANAYIGWKGDGIIGLSAEPGYIQKGGVIKENYTGSEENLRTMLNYLQLPVLLDVFITEKLSASIGPEVSYMLSAKIKSESGSTTEIDWYDKKFELSGMAGMQYAITPHFTLGLRYSHAITPCSKLELIDAH